MGEESKAIIGIGINLKGEEKIENFEISNLNEITDISFDEIMPD